MDNVDDVLTKLATVFAQRNFGNLINAVNHIIDNPNVVENLADSDVVVDYCVSYLLNEVAEEQIHNNPTNQRQTGQVAEEEEEDIRNLDDQVDSMHENYNLAIARVTHRMSTKIFDEILQSLLTIFFNRQVSELVLALDTILADNNNNNNNNIQFIDEHDRNNLVNRCIDYLTSQNVQRPIRDVINNVKETPDYEIDSTCDKKSIDDDDDEKIIVIEPIFVERRIFEPPPDENPFHPCPICCDEFLFCSMIPCNDGHLFCKDCLKNHIEEAVFGQAMVPVVCMEVSCKAIFSQTNLEKAIDNDDILITKLDQRCLEHELNSAAMNDLVRCKYCEYPVIMDLPAEIQKVFTCPSKNCGRSFCRICDLDWNEDHIGRSCDEVETKEQTEGRKNIEEKMAEVVIRSCPSCRAKIVKMDGCNKILCRCGTTMCYICRQCNINYDHFCRHPLSPPYPCNLCNACKLFEDPTINDNRLLADLEKEASNISLYKSNNQE